MGGKDNTVLRIFLLADDYWDILDCYIFIVALELSCFVAHCDLGDR
jgi:hypothetical protein